MNKINTIIISLIISLVFYLVGIFIAFEMFKLWFWLFASNTWRGIFVGITLIGLVKYIWNHTKWTIEKLKYNE